MNMNRKRFSIRHTMSFHAQTPLSWSKSCFRPIYYLTPTEQYSLCSKNTRLLLSWNLQTHLLCHSIDLLFASLFLLKRICCEVFRCCHSGKGRLGSFHIQSILLIIEQESYKRLTWFPSPITLARYAKKAFLWRLYEETLL